jgi:hypothetical protein
MRRTVDLSSKLEPELSGALTWNKEKRAGGNRTQSPRPVGYFAEDYHLDEDRVALESAMSNVKQKPER